MRLTRIIFTFSLVICFQRMPLAGNLASRYLNALSFHSYKKVRTIKAYCKEKRLIGLNLIVYLQAYEFLWERYISWTKFHCHVLEMWEKHGRCVWELILQIIEANWNFENCPFKTQYGLNHWYNIRYISHILNWLMRWTIGKCTHWTY